MIVAFLIGAMIGFVIAIPPGPLSITVFTEAMGKKYRGALSIALGGMIFEGLYAGAGFFGIEALYTPSLQRFARFVGTIFLLLLGAKYVTRKEEALSDHAPVSPAYSKMVLLGAGLTGTMPTILGAYFLLAGILRSYGVFEGTTSNNIAASFGATVGSMSWMLLIVGGISRSLNRINPSVLRNVIRAMGVLLLLLGVGIGIQLVLTL